MADERVYLVTGIDEAGDNDLFTSDNRDRAEARYRRMLTTHTDVQANWLEFPLPTE